MNNNEKMELSADVVAQAEREAWKDLLARMDRVHIDALNLLTGEVEKLLASCEEETEGTLSIHALSLLSAFATVRNSASSAVIAREAQARTRQIEEVAEGVAEHFEGMKEATR